MELCKGGCITDNLNGKNIDETTCAKYMQQIAKALVYCHKKQVVHRDIKPDNIMLGQDQQIKLIDFGLAIKHNPGKKKQEAGTPRFLAPEVLSNMYDTKADIWSLGICLMYMLSGKYAFDERSGDI